MVFAFICYGWQLVIHNYFAGLATRRLGSLYFHKLFATQFLATSIYVYTTISAMTLNDKFLGFLLLLASVAIFLYYTVWVLVLVCNHALKCHHSAFLHKYLNFWQTFLEVGNPVNRYFLPKEYAIAIPSVLLAAGLFVVGIFIGTVLIKEGQKTKISWLYNGRTFKRKCSNCLFYKIMHKIITFWGSWFVFKLFTQTGVA